MGRAVLLQTWPEGTRECGRLQSMRLFTPSYCRLLNLLWDNSARWWDGTWWNCSLSQCESLFCRKSILVFATYQHGQSIVMRPPCCQSTHTALAPTPPLSSLAASSSKSFRLRSHGHTKDFPPPHVNKQDRPPTWTRVATADSPCAPRNERVDAPRATAGQGAPGVLTKEKPEREPESADDLSLLRPDP